MQALAVSLSCAAQSLLRVSVAHVHKYSHHISPLGPRLLRRHQLPPQPLQHLQHKGQQCCHLPTHPSPTSTLHGLPLLPQLRPSQSAAGQVLRPLSTLVISAACTRLRCDALPHDTSPPAATTCNTLISSHRAAHAFHVAAAQPNPAPIILHLPTTTPVARTLHMYQSLQGTINTQPGVALLLLHTSNSCKHCNAMAPCAHRALPALQGIPGTPCPALTQALTVAQQLLTPTHPPTHTLKPWGSQYMHNVCDQHDTSHSAGCR